MGAPERIWLQWYGDEKPEDVDENVKPFEVSWCEDKQFEHDVPYVRESKHDALEKEAIRFAKLASVAFATQMFEDEEIGEARQIQRDAQRFLTEHKEGK